MTSRDGPNWERMHVSGATLRALAAVALIMILLPVAMPVQSSLSTQRHAGRALPENGETPAKPAPEQGAYTLEAGFYYYYQVGSNGAGTSLKFGVSASSAVDIYVMTSIQFGGFRDFGSTSAMYHGTSSSLSQSVPIPTKGGYYLVVDNDISGSSVSIEVTYTTVPVDIYSLHNSPPAPTGVADYGVGNASGYLTPYKETLSEVTGTAVITDVSAFNSSAPTGASPYGASLQLNTMLRVNTTSGPHVYWLQDVLALYTNNQTAYFLDNIWNVSQSEGVLDSSLISGSGSVYPTQQRNYYASAGNIFSYPTPFSVKLPIAVTHSGNRVIVGFGYEQNQGTSPSGAVKFYDNATITEPASVTDAAMVVSGYDLTPNRVFYDAELVFGGQCCSAITTFTSMDSALSMAYRATNGNLLTPRDVYQFGSDTAEGAFGITTSLSQSKLLVSLGELGFASGFALAPPLPIRITISYAVSDGSRPSVSPVLSYTANGTELTSVLGSSSTTFSADGGTEWSVTPTISGASGERWAAAESTNGTAVSDRTVAVTYYHQYMLNASYALSGGGTPSPPVMRTTEFGGSRGVALVVGGSEFWADSGSTWTVPSSLGGSSSSQRWEAATSTTGTVKGPISIRPEYAEQFLLTLDYQVIGGGASGDIPLNVTSLGATSVTKVSEPGTGVWADASTMYQAGSLTSNSGPGERWVSNSTLKGALSAPVTLSLVYYHQYYLNMSASAQGATVTPQSGWFGSGTTVSISNSAVSLWKFSGWTGTGRGSYTGPLNGTALTMEGPVTETAAFEPGAMIESGQGGSVSYLLGATAGSVGPGESIVVYAPVGTPLVLTAQPSLFQKLTSWSGSANGTESVAGFALESPSQAVATFGLDYTQVGGVVVVGFVALAVIYLVVRRRARTGV